MKKNVYIYPLSARLRTGLYNPYLNDLMEALSPWYHFVNRNSPAKNGVFDIFKYLKNLDYIFLNWIEDLPDKKGGYIQIMAFIFLLFYVRKKKIRVVWTIHNKLSHTLYRPNTKLFLVRLLIKKSDFILTHSSEGIKYAKALPGIRNLCSNIRFFHHPVKDRGVQRQVENKYDILIWGALHSYKGVDLFFDFLYAHQLEKKYRILTIGKIISADYERILLSYQNENITIVNKFVDFNELAVIMRQSSVALFTYEKSSVLSSGVLMDSVSYGIPVIGPKVGAFADIEKVGLAYTYRHFDDIEDIMEQVTSIPRDEYLLRRQNFLIKNNWLAFAERFHQWLERKEVALANVK